MLIAMNGQDLALVMIKDRTVSMITEIHLEFVELFLVSPNARVDRYSQAIWW